MIGLVNFLKASGIAINAKNMKIHLACWNGRQDPIDVYYAGGFKVWQEDQKQRNFACGQILSLIDLRGGHWLFVGLYTVLGCKPQSDGRFRYSTELVPGLEDVIGRIIVRHKRNRATYIYYKSDVVLPIVEIRREKMTIGEFPGYNAVIISHDNLKTITRQQIASWHAALANIKGVYLITDIATGRHYVGKASGDSGIWQRWCGYADNGHGGNMELKRLLNEKGVEHMEHFQFSILEIADGHASDADILRRESYWMNVLRTRGHGLN